jgi:hypothetical protein
MAQYMPLDNQEGANQQHHVTHADDIWNGSPFLEQHRRSVQHFTCAAAPVDIRLCRGQLGVKIQVVCGIFAVPCMILRDTLLCTSFTTQDEQHRGWYHHSLALGHL